MIDWGPLEAVDLNQTHVDDCQQPCYLDLLLLAFVVPRIYIQCPVSRMSFPTAINADTNWGISPCGLVGLKLAQFLFFLTLRDELASINLSLENGEGEDAIGSYGDHTEVGQE